MNLVATNHEEENKMIDEIVEFVFESIDSSLICEEFGETIYTNKDDKYMIVEKDDKRYKIIVEEF